MAELVCCLSIIPHMRSFDVPPKLSPAHAGLFLRRENHRDLIDAEFALNEGGPVGLKNGKPIRTA
jgi:hypothetical protein